MRIGNLEYIDYWATASGSWLVFTITDGDGLGLEFFRCDDGSL